jgi:hypothetical protein
VLLDHKARVDNKSLQFFCSNFCSSNCEKLLVQMISLGADLNAGIVRCFLFHHIIFYRACLQENNVAQGTEEKTALHCAVLNTRENRVEGLVGAILMLQLLLKCEFVPFLWPHKTNVFSSA